MKTQERILKEMKGYEKRYRKLHFYEQLLKIFLFVVVIIYLISLCLKITNYNIGYEKAVFFLKILGIFLIILSGIIYIIQNRILKKYLILICDTNINVVNKLRFYKKKKEVEQIKSVTVTKMADKEYKLIIEGIVSGKSKTVCINLNRAHSYLDIR